jgi:hypothetical protein
MVVVIHGHPKLEVWYGGDANALAGTLPDSLLHP